MKRFWRLTLLLLVIVRHSLLFVLLLSHASISLCGEKSLTLFSTNRYAESTLSSAEENGDTRNFTAEAVFIESSVRNNRTLTDTEKEQIARIKTFSETFNLIRYRSTSNSLLDFSFKGRKIDNAQLTDFFSTSETNEVELAEYGLAYQHTWRTDDSDVVLRSGYRRTERIGLIEFLPKSTDEVDTFELNAAYSLIGANDDRVITFYSTYAYQDIELNIAAPFDRKREIAAVAFVTGGTRSTCRECMGDQLSPSPSNPILRSSLENIFARQYDYTDSGVHGGYALDIETFGNVEVTRQDFYLGFTAIFNKMLLTVEPALFTSEVSDDESQDIGIVRLSIIPAFDNLFKRRVKLRIPLIYDQADEGADYFDNWRAGVQLSQPFCWGRNKRSKFHLGAGITYKEYLNIDRNDTLWNIVIAISI